MLCGTREDAVPEREREDQEEAGEGEMERPTMPCWAPKERIRPDAPHLGP